MFISLVANVGLYNSACYGKKTSAKLEVPSKRNDVHLLLESSVDKLGEVLLKLKVSKTFLQVS